MTRRSPRGGTHAHTRRRKAGHARAGAVLLEVIIALAILATAGATITALWPRADLDRHLGERTQGHWRMRVDRPTPTLYVVTLTDGASNVELLRTALFRPEPSHASE